MQASLRIGCVKYLNARPLIRGWPGEIVFDHPSVLTKRLANNELDVALVSSFEFLRNPIYRIVDGVAIASDGPVYSVFVAHARGISSNEIELDPASTTAVALLRALAAERGEEFSGIEMNADKLSPLPPACGGLLIGDQAIRFRQKFGSTYEYRDLGEEWRKLTGLPFVYALWLARPEVLDAKTIADRLRSVRDQNLSTIDTLIAEETNFDPDFCRVYYRENLRFHFGESEKEGLRAFQRLCVKHGLLPKSDLEFNLV